MTARLKRLEIAGFRGFAERTVIDLDADAVVVRGDNGTGKTSLVDALLWLFVGNLPHLVERQRGLRRTEDVVTNRFKSGDATVALTIDANGEERTFLRTGSQRKTTLNAWAAHDQAADPQGLLVSSFGLSSIEELAQAVQTWGMLRQDAIRAALDEAGGALHERLSGLIGLEQVSAFARAATRASDMLIRTRTDARRSKGLADERHNRAIEAHETALRAAGSATQVSQLLKAGLEDTARRLATSVVLQVPPVVDLEVVSRAGVTMRQLIEGLDNLLRCWEDVASQSPEEEDELGEVERSAAAAGAAAAEATQRAPVLVQLASAASGLLGDHCPVCGQTIDEASVRRHLAEVLEGAQAVARSAQETQDALASAQSRLASARARVQRRRAAEARLEETEAAFGNLCGDVSDVVEIDVAKLDPPSIRGLRELLAEAVDGLRELYRTVQEASGSHVARLADDLEAARRESATANKAVLELDARCKQAKELEVAAHDAAQKILEDALEALTPSFAEVFDRLAPSPAFTELHAKQDVLRNRNQIVPMVRDPEREVDANPMLIFSEGQLNVVALSYFLGLALNARGASLPFLVLDDPLQSLDVIAILGFSDLCRQIRDGRQLIVTTHDRRFADVLIRKLTPRDREQSLIVHSFDGWTREGPILTTETAELAAVIPLLRQEAS